MKTTKKMQKYKKDTINGYVYVDFFIIKKIIYVI